MKKTELKKILKPLIKECIKEVIFEDGVLSGLISEVAKGMSPTSVARASAPATDPIFERLKRNAFPSKQNDNLKEHKAKLMAAIGGGGNAFNGVNLFEGTTPVIAQATSTQQSTPLSGINPGDAGVDISDLFGGAKRHWAAHLTDLNKKESR
jgi:hypothetical protein